MALEQQATRLVEAAAAAVMDLDDRLARARPRVPRGREHLDADARIDHARRAVAAGAEHDGGAPDGSACSADDEAVARRADDRRDRARRAGAR